MTKTEKTTKTKKKTTKATAYPLMAAVDLPARTTDETEAQAKDAIRKHLGEGRVAFSVGHVTLDGQLIRRMVGRLTG